MHKVHTIQFKDPLNTGDILCMAFSSEDSLKHFRERMDAEFNTRLVAPIKNYDDTKFQEIIVHDSTDEAMVAFTEAAKERALKKLTTADLAVLGLKEKLQS